MKNQSDEFVLHQYRYYGAHLGGRNHDAGLIAGLYRQAADELLRRGLIYVDLKTNQYKEREKA